MDWTHLKVMTALVIGQPITKEVAASKVTCVILIWKKSLFSSWTWTKSPLSRWIWEKARLKFELSDVQISKKWILSSQKLTSETSDMQVESQTSDKGTWEKMAVMIGLHCTGCLFFAKLLRSFQRKVFAKPKTQLRWFRIEGLDRQDVPPWTRLVPR